MTYSISSKENLWGIRAFEGEDGEKKQETYLKK